VDVPTDEGAEVELAALWGHWDQLLLARAAGVPWYEDTAFGAANGGHLRLLQQLHYHGCPWDYMVLEVAIANQNVEVAIWCLDHGVPDYGDYTWRLAAQAGCLEVLQWASNHKQLVMTDIPELRQIAAAEGHTDIIAWLDSEMAVGAG
jgi:hypothetical protein